MSAALVLLFWLRAVALDPIEASQVAARAAGVPGWTSELLDLADVESRGRAIGVHRDARPDVCRVPGRRFWRKAVRAGDLDPARCEHHQLGDGERWGIRGAHGLAAAYSVRYLGPCVAPEALDVPLLSAIVTARRLAVLEQRYGLRDRLSRARAWRLGVGAVRQGPVP